MKACSVPVIQMALMCSFMQNENNASNSSLADTSGRRSSLKHSASIAIERQGGTLKPYQSVRLKKRITMYSNSSSNSKINFGDANDDVHVCILCLRAIMNHQVMRNFFLYFNILSANSFYQLFCIIYASIVNSAML